MKHSSGGYVFTSKATDVPGRACNCIGPQIGQPVCPCMMRGVEIIDGRYVRTVDLGPAPKGEGTIGNPQDLARLFKGAIG